MPKPTTTMPPDPEDFEARIANATSGTGWRMSGKDRKAGLKATSGPRKGRSLAEITADVENEMAQEQSGLPIAGRSSLSRGAGPVSTMNGGESGIDWLKRNGPGRGTQQPADIAPQKSVYAPLEVGSLGSFQDGKGIFSRDQSVSETPPVDAEANPNPPEYQPTYDLVLDLPNIGSSGFPLSRPSALPLGPPLSAMNAMKPPQRGGLKPAPSAGHLMSGGIYPGRTIGQTNAMVARNFPIQPPKPMTPAAQPLEPLQTNGKARRRPKSSLIV